MKKVKTNNIIDFARDILSKFKNTFSAYLAPKAKGHKNIVNFRLISRDGSWMFGADNNKTVMDVYCRCNATNVAKKVNVEFARVVLVKTKTEGTTTVSKVDGDIWGAFLAPDKYMAEIDMNFRIGKPFLKRDQSFTSDIIVYDCDKNKQTLRNIEFKYR